MRAGQVASHILRAGSGTTRQLLDFQADRIEAVLARHKVPARVTGGHVAPRWIQFQVVPTLGARVKKVKGLAEEMALALGCDTCRISRQGALFSVEIPRSDPQPVHLLTLHRRLVQACHAPLSRSHSDFPAADSPRTRRMPFGAAVLGLAEDGAPLLIRLPSPQVAHILIAGTTGSGKSALAQTIIASLVLSHRPSQFGFVLIDPKRRAFGPFAGLPHMLRPVLSEPAEIQYTLEMLVQLMLARDHAGRIPVEDGRPGEPRVVVVIDELADLLMTADKQTQEALTRLSQRGREAGIHLVACTQKPASMVIGSLAKANFPVRLVGRVTSPEDAKVATGYAGTGAERLQGPGDFVAVTGAQVTRFQAAFVSSRELSELVKQIDELNPGQANRRSSGWANAVPISKVLGPVSSMVTELQRTLVNDFESPVPVRRLTGGVCPRSGRATVQDAI